MICAYWIKNKNSVRYYYIILLIGIPCFILLFPCHHEIYNFKYFSLIFLLPVFTICFIFFSKYIKLLNPILAIIGKASLETYLIQAIFFNTIISGQLTIPSTWHDVITIGLIIISSLLGILVHMIIDKSGILRLI
jgi:peptidoglycan/LPS O-acetylase OafA/YrhL